MYPASASKFLCVVVIIAGFASAAKAQVSGSTKRLSPLPNKGQTVSGRPRAIQQQPETMTVFLELAGDPVAVVRARTPGKRVSAAIEQSIVRSLRAQQDALTPLIQVHGGKILARLQYAINGIKVRATADQVAELAKLPGVVAVKPVRVYTLNNATSVPFLGTPTVWQGPPGLHGEHIKVAVLDTGIDYTHANFGGPGTVAAFQAAAATSTLPADPTMFGPSAPKVKGGTDLVGDKYDAGNPASTPQPDPNPLDCGGHGSHVAGTIAGFGVSANGTTYSGPYDSTTPGNSFLIGPGVAPLADIYSVRVFGCSGSTNVVTEAIDWAVANNMNVISMSLGASFGSPDSADAVASTNAENSGIVVVAAAGNSGNIPYITGAPAVADKAISVAAMDSHASYPGINLALSGGSSILTQDSNEALVTDGTSLPITVLRNGNGTISLGCNDSEYQNVAGQLVVTLRGVCPRVQRAMSGQAHGAAAVAMINNSAGYPPIEGPIAGVSIPFLGVLQSDGTALAAASSATLTNNSGLRNSTFRNFASFTSSGPRSPDSHLKPDVTAPGVNIISTGSGSGNQGVMESGTSMATPHVSGVAALALQAHPTWTPDNVRLAILNSADPTQLAGFTPRLGGSGLVQPIGATLTSVVARADDDAGSLSFGLDEFSQDYQGTQGITVSNHGSQTANFNVSAAATAGSSPHSSTIEPSLSVPPGQTATLHLDLTVPAATAGDSSAFREVAGLVTLTPASSSDNSGVSLSVPYYLVPLARSQVSTTLGSSFGLSNPSTTAQVSNGSTAVSGTADFYAWGLTGGNSALGSVGLRAVGVQANPVGNDELLFFAVNTFAPWSYGGLQEFDILIDVNGDGNPDYILFSDDEGLVTAGAFSGQVVDFLHNVATNKTIALSQVTAPYNGSTLLMPVFASEIGLTTGNPRFSYSAESFDLLSSNTDVLQGPAKFNAFQTAITTAAFVSLSPGGSANVPLAINSAEWANTPALGEMIVSLDNFARAQQAQLLPVSGPPATTTNLSSSLNPSTYGQAVTFTANVTGPGGTPTGSVTFSDGATQLGTATLSSGNATFTTSVLTAGGHSITASYSGDTNFAAGISGPLAQNVNQATTTTGAVSSTIPSIYGQPITFTATVSSLGGTPTGTVTFTDGANTLGTRSVDPTGNATFTTASLSVGPHSITAAYGGDLNFASSASSAISQVVNQASTTLVLASGPNPSVYGQTVTLMATISPQFGGQASGFVTFNDGANTTTVAVSNNQASYATNSLAAKTHSLSASYSGDGNFLGSTSATVSQVVNKASSGTALISSINPVVQGKPVKFTATVSPQIIGVPTGKVNFLNGSTILATHALTAGVATYSTSSLPAGTSNISAVYLGDGNFNGSASAPVAQVVTAAVTTVVTSSTNPSTYGQAVSFTATLTSSIGPPPDGETVTFMKGAAVLGTGTLANGLATFTTSSLTPGTYSVKAVYAGDATFAASSSAVLKQTVNKAATTIALTSSPNPSTKGTAVTFTATVSSDAGTPTGSVTFASDGTTLGSKSLSSGGAILKTSALTTGSHNITATYNGSSNFATSTTSLTQTVQ